METVFISKLKPFLDAVAEEMTLYVPKQSESHYVYTKYDAASERPAGLNNVRACTTVKDFLLPVCELAAVYPKPAEPEEIKPFAIFGLKDCDLRSIEILDKVFAEEEFEEPVYLKRRENMLIISSDCFELDKNCFCSLLGGQSFAKSGFDLNVCQIKDGFIIEAGSEKGKDFVEKHSGLFSEATEAGLAERDENRAQVQKQLEEYNAEYRIVGSVRDAVEDGQEAEVFDDEAKNCVECQACTRICPTCHCFYLYDTKRADYFAKMKMWDGCMRMAYAAVAGGAIPRKVLGDRLKHRFMHKYVYFFDRYGLDMCVGCGRCIDTCIGGIDTRAMLKKLSEAKAVK